LEKYETKVNSISKLMHEAYKKRRESCLTVAENFKESTNSPQSLDKTLLSKYNFNFSKLTNLNVIIIKDYTYSIINKIIHDLKFKIN